MTADRSRVAAADVARLILEAVQDFVVEETGAIWPEAPILPMPSVEATSDRIVPGSRVTDGPWVVRRPFEVGRGSDAAPVNP